MKFLGIAATVLLFGVPNALGGNYDGKVEYGMTYMQIVQLIGEEGEKIEDYMFGSSLRYETYRWEKTVRRFVNGRLHDSSEETFVPKSKIKKSPLDNFENPDLHPIDDSKDLNAGKFEAVRIDMKPKEVFGILGKTYIPVKTYTDDTVDKYKRVTFFQWFNEYSRGSMNVIFLDDQVVGKGQVGLTDPATVGSVELTVGMNSEKVISLLGANSTCRKYMEVTFGEGHKVMNLCRWRTNIGVKMNVIFLDDMLVGSWKY
jgi:hypothetical protein